MDFSKIKKADKLSAELIVKSPATGKLTDVRITLVSAESAQYLDALRTIQKQRQAKRDLNPDLPQDAVDGEAVELLALCTLGWTGVKEGKTEVPFSVEAAKKLYTEHLWLQKQVDRFIADGREFFQD